MSLLEHHVNTQINKGDTQERRACEDGGKNRSDPAANQGMPRIVGNNQEPGEKSGTESPSEPLEGTNAVDTLVSYF